MLKPTLVVPSQLRGIVSMQEAIEAVRMGFCEWGQDLQVNAPRRRIHIPSGVRVSVHQGGVPGACATGLMAHCELVKPLNDHQEYAKLNYPVIVLYDAAEGDLKGIIIGEITCSELPDNLAVTGLRTAATSAVGTDLLARKDSETLGLLGSAGQARNHLVAFCRIRNLRRIKVYSRTPENRRRFAEEMGRLLNVNIEPVASPEHAVRGMDMVLAATNASTPVFDGSWLEPGAHVTSIVGSNVGLVKGGFTKAKRREIDDMTLRRSAVIGINSIQQAIQDEQGDIFDPVETGLIHWDQIIEIGQILAKKKEGRTKLDQITLFKNNAGQGVADVALGSIVLNKVLAKGAGQTLDI